MGTVTKVFIYLPPLNILSAQCLPLLKYFLMVFPDHASDNASQLQISPGSDDRIFRIGSLPINLAVEHQLLEEMKKVKTGYRNQRFVFVSVRSCQLVHFPAAG